MIRVVSVLLVLTILALQYKAWFSDTGYFAVAELREQVAAQRDKADDLARDNDVLLQEVLALRDGHTAIEARARQDLGMVGENEVFFVVPEPGRAGPNGG